MAPNSSSRLVCVARLGSRSGRLSDSSARGPLSFPRERTRLSMSCDKTDGSAVRGGGDGSVAAVRSSVDSAHILGFVLRLPELELFVVGLVSDLDSEVVPCCAGTSGACSGAATPKKVATASQELLRREGSDLGFAGSGPSDTGCSTSTGCSTRAVAFGGLGGPSDFLIAGAREGVLSRFAMLFQ